tara:strand:+ start:508 stop:1608 length:1101 start_codon:yes stop_codon:yes gene_type:complete
MPKNPGSGRKARVKSVFELSLIDNITSLGRPNGQPYSPKSVLTYTNNLFNFSKQFTETFYSLEFLDNYKNVVETLSTATTAQNKLYSISTKIAMLNAIIISLLASGQVYSDDSDNIIKNYSSLRDKLTEEIRMINVNAIDNHQDTTIGNNQKSVLNSTDKKDIFKMIEEMNNKSFDDEGELINHKLYMIATMFMVHTEFPFRNDLADVRFTTPAKYKQEVKNGTDTEFNWLILESKKKITFVLNQYKTKSRYGKIIAPVESKRVIEQLNKWLFYGRHPSGSDYLFTWAESGKPLTRNNISVLMSTESSKYLGSPVSTTLLAKIFNETASDYKQMTEAEKEELRKKSYLRGDAPTTHFTIYRNTGLS